MKRLAIAAVILALLAAPAWYWWKSKTEFDARVAQRAAAAQEAAALADDVDRTTAILKRFEDASALASRTGRIALAGPVGQMQAAQRELAGLKLGACVAAARTDLDDGMQHTINGYLAFMGDDEQASNRWLAGAMTRTARGRIELDVCREKAARPPV